MAKKKTDVAKHALVPEHAKLSEKDKAALLADLKIEESMLPRIKKKDPAIKKLACKQGDVIKISRASPTAGETTFYRVVINA